MLTFYWLTGTWTFSVLFPIEIMISEFILLFRKDLEKKDILRLVLCLLGYILIFLFLPAILPPSLFTSDSEKWIRDVYEILVLAIYFVSSFALVGYGTGNHFHKSFFCGLATYNLQHLVYAVSSIVLDCIPNAGDTPNLVLYVSLCIYPFLFGGSFYLRSKLKMIDDFEIKNYRILTLTAAVVTINIVLGTLVRMAPYMQETDIFIKTYSIVCSSILLFFQFSILRNQTMERQLYSTQLMWEKDKKNYEIQKSSIEDVNIKYHDLRHFINSFEESGMGDNPYLERLKKELNEENTLAQTGNTALNIVVSEKKMYCSKNGIRFTFLGDGGKLGFVDSIDVYSLFENILDNAIEASLAIPDEKKRVISLTISPKDNLLSIQCSNYFEGKLNYQDGVIQTSKPDKGYHGYGMKSIDSIVRKYQGHLVIAPEGNTFRLSILFPLQEK
jgi:hypothetical protein